MKKIFTYLLAGLSLLSFSRCDSLDIEPTSSLAGTTKNHSKKMKTSEFQRIQRFSFCFNCAKHADLGISIVPNSWLFFEPLKKATI